MTNEQRPKRYRWHVLFGQSFTPILHHLLAALGIFVRTAVSFLLDGCHHIQARQRITVARWKSFLDHFSNIGTYRKITFQNGVPTVDVEYRLGLGHCHFLFSTRFRIRRLCD